MIIIKNKQMLLKMEHAGQCLAQILEDVAKQLVPGVSTYTVDQWVEQKLKEAGLVSVMKGYAGYKHVTCISINDEVVHGVPSKNKIMQKGDLVKIDVCASWKGYCADMARSFFVGKESANPEAVKLVQVAQQALDRGISQCVPGNRLGDISAAIQSEIDKHKLGIVRDFAGHGIGKDMHEAPEILNYGTAGEGVVLREGMVFALEPMIMLGAEHIYIADDGWTVKTKDGSWATQVEDTVVVTAHGPKIITRYKKQEGEVGEQDE